MQSQQPAPAAYEPLTPEKIAQNLQPADEAALTAIPGQAYSELRKAANEYQEGVVKRAWSAAWCAAMARTVTLKDWSGIVWELKSPAVIGNDTGPDTAEVIITLPTYDDRKVFAEFKTTDPLFQQSAANLRPGQIVKFSGVWINREADNTGCDLFDQLADYYPVALSAVTPVSE